MLGYTKVVAPFDGVITRKLADVGDLATPGKPIAEMEDPSALRFEADVPEALIGSRQARRQIPGARQRHAGGNRRHGRRNCAGGRPGQPHFSREA